MKPSDYTVLAAGPAFGGPATRPYRHVVLKWRDGKYSRHRQYLDDIGGVDEGHYAKEFTKALGDWVAKVQYELAERPNCLLELLANTGGGA